MTDTLQVPIREQEHLKEFIQLLSQNGHKREAALGRYPQHAKMENAASAEMPIWGLVGTARHYLPLCLKGRCVVHYGQHLYS